MTERSKKQQPPDSRNGERGGEGREGGGNLIPSHIKMKREGNDKMMAEAK